MILYGAGGLGVVTLDVLNANQRAVHFCLDDGLAGNELFGVPIVATDALDRPDGPVRSDHEMLVCIGSCDRRAEIVRAWPGRWGQAIHPGVLVADSASIGAGTLVFQGGIVQARSIIGEHCILNTAASIDHDCVIGDFVHIGPQSTLCGLVEVGHGADIGASVTIIPSVRVGEGAIIGAGSVVLNDVPAHSTVVGAPARVIRQRTPVPTAMNAHSAA